MLTLSSKSLLLIQPKTDVQMPVPGFQQLPERILQFGTGVLLRGLPDYLVDKANRQGLFNGRIVVVKSTSGGDIDAFARQNNLYSLCVRGVENGRIVEQNIINSAISRVLSAIQQWNEILNVAASPDLQLVISNTTEVGIQLVHESIRQSPPQSFPAKLLAVLYARYLAFNGDPDKGLVIVPTELIPDNGAKLEAILLELAHRNELESEFIDWLEMANTCCNSLVDRIVPGQPDPATQHALAEQLGYEDDLLIVLEAYRLWAIEIPEGRDPVRLKQTLSFCETDENCLILPDISPFRELKLRLLNGTHTLSCGVAVLAGFDTVREAMEDEVMLGFMRNLMRTELMPCLSPTAGLETVEQFGSQVLDRFRNPFIEHRWLAITMQYSAKLQMRCLAALLYHYQHPDLAQPPALRYIPFSFAAYLLFMRATSQKNEVWYGERANEVYPIYDDQAGYFADLWRHLTPVELTETVLQNTALWGHDLSQLPGFVDAVTNYLTQLIDQGVRATLAASFARAELIAQ